MSKALAVFTVLAIALATIEFLLDKMKDTRTNADFFKASAQGQAVGRA